MHPQIMSNHHTKYQQNPPKDEELCTHDIGLDEQGVDSISNIKRHNSVKNQPTVKSV